MSLFYNLCSSSSGNATFVGDREGGLLFDAGVGIRNFSKWLLAQGLTPDSVRGIFLTHEHSDHVAGLRVFAAKYDTPVYATAGTLEALDDMRVLDGRFNTFVLGEAGTDCGALFVQSFCTPHDSRESCGYVLTAEDGSRVAVATDLGEMTDTVLTALKGCETVLLESNHDVRMLQSNPQYPYPLKKRILGTYGHLCNEACAEAACTLVESGTQHLFLGHLSEQNNLPALAYRVTSDALQAHGAQADVDFTLTVASPVWVQKAVQLCSR